MTEPAGGAIDTSRHSASHNLPRLHRPRRGFIAAGEVILAAALVWIAFLCWETATTAVAIPLATGTVSRSEVLSGTWVALAVIAGSIAGLLLLDAVRQAMLAVYAPHRRPKKAHLVDESEKL